MADGKPFPYPCIGFEGRDKITDSEAAQALSCCRKHVLNLIEEKELPAVRQNASGRTYFIKVEDWRAWVISRMYPPEDRMPKTPGRPVKRKPARAIR